MTRRTRRTRRRGGEEEEEDEAGGRRQEEATDIKSNNPHLAGGENKKTMGIMNSQMGMCQNLVPLVNPKIAGKWMFIPLKMYL